MMGEILDPVSDQLGELGQQPPALGGGQLAPFAGKRALGRFDRRIDIGGPSASDFADLNAARRVLDRQALARSRLDPAPADEALVGIEPGRFCARTNSFQHFSEPICLV